MGSIPGLGRSPAEGSSQPTPVFLPGESQGQISLAGYSLWSRKVLDLTAAAACLITSIYLEKLIYFLIFI